MDKQMDYAIDNRIPFIIFLGENEVKENKIKIKVNNIKTSVWLINQK